METEELDQISKNFREFVINDFMQNGYFETSVLGLNSYNEVEVLSFDDVENNKDDIFTIITSLRETTPLVIFVSEALTSELPDCLSSDCNETMIMVEYRGINKTVWMADIFRYGEISEIGAWEEISDGNVHGFLNMAPPKWN